MNAKKKTKKEVAEYYVATKLKLYIDHNSVGQLKTDDGEQRELGAISP
jgi:hypothetical protein